MVVVKLYPCEMTWKYWRARVVRKTRRPLFTSGMAVPVTHWTIAPRMIRAGSLNHDSR